MAHSMLRISDTETTTPKWNSGCWDEVHLLRRAQKLAVDAFYSDYPIGSMTFAHKSLQEDREANVAHLKEMRRGEGEVETKLKNIDAADFVDVAVLDHRHHTFAAYSSASAYIHMAVRRKISVKVHLQIHTVEGEEETHARY